MQALVLAHHSGASVDRSFLSAAGSWTQIFQRTNLEPETGLEFSGIKLPRRRPNYSKQVQCLYVAQFLLDEAFVMFTGRLR